jgi:CRP-like cAMP-binding protein
VSDTDEPLALLVHRLETQAELSAQDRGALLKLPYTIKAFDASTYLLREGEAPSACAVLVSGFAYRHKISVDGAKQIVSLHVPGEPLDFQHLFLNEADHNIQTLTRGEAALVPREAFRKLAQERPAVMQALLVNVLVEASIFREWVLNVGRRDGRSRIAHLLCEFAIRLDAQGLTNSNGYELPMTQEQIGDATGQTAVHVNRMLKALEKEGLVKRMGRCVSFADWRALRDIAGFGERYLHLGKQGA